MISKALTLLLLAGTALASSGEDACNDPDRPPSQWLVSDDSCSPVFYSCVPQQDGSFNAVEMNCPDPLVFDEESMDCDWEDAVASCSPATATPIVPTEEPDDDSFIDNLLDIVCSWRDDETQ